MQQVGLVFDLDGVITDTAEFHYLAWKQLADEEGLPFTREDNERLRGVSRRESLNRLLNGHSVDEETAQTWMYRKNEYYKRFLAAIGPSDVLPGVVEFLTEARAHHHRIGLASASRNARMVIEKLALTEIFDVIGDGNVVCNTKPAPDLFVWVAGGLGLPVSSCVVFEDAEAGIEAGLQAGMVVIGIGPQTRVGHAHFRIEGLHDLSLTQLIDLISTESKSHFA